MGVAERKARQFEHREQEILAAALGLAAQGDWRSVTIDQIAERAEIGKGTVYKHFGSKDEVCARIVTDQAGQVLAKLQAIDRAAPLLERLRQAMGVVWTQMLSNEDIYALNEYCESTAWQLNLSEEAAQRMQCTHGEIHAYFAGLIGEGVAQGLFVERPVEHLLCVGQGALSGSMRLLQGGVFPGLDKAAVLDSVCAVVLNGLLRRDVLRRDPSPEGLP